MRAGYLPSFWIKLRVLSAPAITSTAVHSWPVRLCKHLSLATHAVPLQRVTKHKCHAVGF